MKKIIFTVLLIVISSFNVFAQTKVTKEEYAVYANILKMIYRENQQTYSNATQFVFLNNTSKGDSDISIETKIKSLKSDFERKNKVSTKLERKFPIKYIYFLISQNKLDQHFKNGEIELGKIRERNKSRAGKTIETGAEIWIPFYEKYPKAQGYYSFSRVGFSSNKNFAMVCVNNDSNLFGFSRIYMLKNVKGKWKIVRFYGSESSS